jgi:heat shock protein HtpX
MDSHITDIHTINWRQILRVNAQKTIIVIFLFFLLYIAFGLLLDFIWAIVKHPGMDFFNVTHFLRTIHFFPYITFIMLGMAIFTLLFSIVFTKELILLGTNYVALNDILNKSSQEIVLENIVEEMTIASGIIRKPAIYILPREDINAFASGFDIESSFLVVTSGLLNKLNRNEIEGVIAHEITHIKYLDIRLSLIVTILTKWMNIIINSIFNFIIYFAKGLMENINDDEGSMEIALVKAVFLLLCIFFLWPLWVAIIILKIICYPITSILLFYLDRTREIHADTGAIQLLRISEGIGEALIKIEKDYQENISIYQKQLYLNGHENLRFDLYFYDPRLLNDMGNLLFFGLFQGQPSVSDRLKNIGLNKKTI